MLDTFIVNWCNANVRVLPMYREDFFLALYCINKIKSALGLVAFSYRNKLHLFTDIINRPLNDRVVLEYIC